MISVLTITRGTSKQLWKQARALACGGVAPDEWVVVGANRRPILPGCPFETTVRSVDGDPRELLAPMRNAAAEAARGDVLICLGSNSIPDANVIAKLSASVAKTSALWTSHAVDQPQDRTDTSLPTGRRASKGERVNRLAIEYAKYRDQDLPARLFESHCFAISSSDFTRVGGFAEHLHHPGVVDLDFAFRTKNIGLKTRVVDAVVRRTSNELNRLRHDELPTFVKDAEHFFAAWGVWPKRGWLTELERMGVIVVDSSQGKLSVERSLSPGEFSHWVKRQRRHSNDSTKSSDAFRQCVGNENMYYSEN